MIKKLIGKIKYFLKRVFPVTINRLNRMLAEQREDFDRRSDNALTTMNSLIVKQLEEREERITTMNALLAKQLEEQEERQYKLLEQLKKEFARQFAEIESSQNNKLNEYEKRRAEQTEAFEKLAERFNERLEDKQKAVLEAVCKQSESIDSAQRNAQERAENSEHAILRAVSELQPSIEQVQNISNLICNGMAGVENAVHWRGSRMESVIQHLIPREELSFEVALAEHCNLNCAGCDHFSPVSEPEFADLGEYTKDFSRIAELFGNHIGEVHLLGGEPLLHPDVMGFFKAARDFFPEATIDVTTNGILLLKEPESFWTSCRENRIVVRPTKYPISLPFEKLEALAEQYEVEYRYIGNTGTVLKTMDRYKLDVRGLQDGNRSFMFCHRANTCVYLAHGRLYTCTIAPTVRHFNKAFNQNLRLSPEDSIDIYEASSAKEIMEFLAKPIPFCRYCNVEGTEYNVPWSQSKKSIEEWT